MTCPRCQLDNPSHAKFCLACGGPLGAAVVADPSYEELRAENEELRRSRDTAIEQQTATSEILRVISQSPTDVQPVFEAIAENALRLCEATFSAVFKYDGELIHLAALRNMTQEGAAAIRDVYAARSWGRSGSVDSEP